MLSPDTDSKSVIDFLKENSTAKQFSRVLKRGIPEQNILGTPKGFVTRAANAIGSNQKLAEALWKTECHEARLVAILIADPANLVRFELGFERIFFHARGNLEISVEEQIANQTDVQLRAMLEDGLELFV